MHPSTTLSILALTAHLAYASSVGAQSLIDGSDPDAIVNIARGFGSASLQQDGMGDPQIMGRMNGVPYLVHFYGCMNGQNCKALLFQAAWTNPGTVTLEQVNVWNSVKRFGKAYLDDENDPVVEWDVNLFGGVSPRNLEDAFDWWRLVLENFPSEMF
jgi:hypothetical protein